jgi:adenosylcobinamide-phosphate guanylyltransferase
MCGGEGTRLGFDQEKPLVPVGGRPMVDRVIDALEGSGVDRVLGAPSPSTPRTREHLSVPCLETPGDGYVEDLQRVLADPAVDPPVLTVAADIPLLTATAVDHCLAAWTDGSVTVAVPVRHKRGLGVSVDSSFQHEGRTVAPSGLNVVGAGTERTLLRSTHALAVNVNRPRDLQVAEALCRGPRKG